MNFAERGVLALDFRYEHEASGRARQRNNAPAANPSAEVVDFDTAIFALRYGATDRLNLAVTVPLLSIASDKVQGEPYLRENRGLGDLVAMAGYRVLDAPALVIEGGLRLPTGDIDRTDGLGNRINDILALGSGTTDPILGLNVYRPSLGVRGLDAFGAVRHRIAGGTNKWGYRFGNETQFLWGATYLWRDRIRLTPQFDAYRLGQDRWLGNLVPERGARFVHFAPEIAVQFSPDLTLGFYYRVPLWMDLEGAQMVAEGMLGVTSTVNLSPIVARLRGTDRGESGDGGEGGGN